MSSPQKRGPKAAGHAYCWTPAFVGEDYAAIMISIMAGAGRYGIMLRVQRRKWPVNENRESWSGRTGFILATIGSAVGLGSIWKFPYEVGANGGTAFVFFYLAGLVLIVVPLMFAEFAIGRRGRGDAAASIRAVAAEHGAGRGWALAGLLGILTGFIILSFYSVIGGWTIAYALETLTHGLPPAEPEAVQARFDALLGSPLRLTIFHAVFVAATAAVVVRGVHGGIEAASKLLMPLLILLMLLLALYGIVE